MTQPCQPTFESWLEMIEAATAAMATEDRYVVLPDWAVAVFRRWSGLHERGGRYEYKTPRRGALRKMERRLVLAGKLK